MEKGEDKQEDYKGNPMLKNTISNGTMEDVMVSPHKSELDIFDVVMMPNDDQHREPDGDVASINTTTTTKAVGGWSRTTTILVLAVVMLLAALVVVVPVLLTRSSKIQTESTSANKLASNENSKPLVDAADRQGPLIPTRSPSPMALGPVSAKPPIPSSLFSKPPGTFSPVVFAPVTTTSCPDCPSGCGKLTINSETTCCENGEAFIFNGTDYESYCVSLPIGESCFESQQCESYYVCVLGTCAESRLPSGSPCSTYDDCQTFACGILSSLNETNQVCCPYADVVIEQKNASFCARTVENGQPCLVDELCKSGICISETVSDMGVCREERLPSGSVCQRDNNCQDRYCGFTEFGPPDSNNTKICCPGGRGTHAYFEPLFEPTFFCARIIPEGDPCEADTGNVLCKSRICVRGSCATDRLPNGADCEQSSDCKSFSCAYDSINLTTRKSVCCRNTFGFFDGAFYDEYCVKSIPTGESCDPLDGRRSLALNGNTNNNNHFPPNSFPVAAPVNSFPSAPVISFPSAPVRGPFASPVSPPFPFIPSDVQDLSPLCQSGICAGGTCAEDRLAANETCIYSSECASQSCALPFYNTNAQDKVCCAGSYIYICESFGCDIYCAGSVPNGGACPKMDIDGGRICQSGVCTDGVCSDDRLPDGELCTSFNQCASRACGFDSAVLSSRKSICCSSGDVQYLFDRFDYNGYCTRSVPVGGKCLAGTQDLDDANGDSGSKMCISGICIEGVCASGRLRDNAPCTSANVCESGACGFDSLDFNTREKVCCNATCSSQLFDGFSYDDYCVGIQDVGDSCSVWDMAGPNDQVHPELCSTGICIDKVCAAELIGINGTCTASTDCSSGACGFTSVDTTTSEKICCENYGYTTSIFDGICGYDEFCIGSFPTGAECAIRGTLHNELCQSFECEAGICLENNGTEFSIDMVDFPPSGAPVAMPIGGGGGGGGPSVAPIAMPIGGGGGANETSSTMGV